MLEKQQTWSEKSFNSMKVRLKRGGNFDFEVREQFQFHEGPIKTYKCTRSKFSTDEVSIP